MGVGGGVLLHKLLKSNFKWNDWRDNLGYALICVLSFVWWWDEWGLGLLFGYDSAILWSPTSACSIVAIFSMAIVSVVAPIAVFIHI